MDTFTIWADGLAYAGEAEGTEAGVPFNANGSGWRDVTGDRQNVLVFGGEPHRIEGHANLRSQMDRIFRRLRAGQLTATEIVIRRESSPR